MENNRPIDTGRRKFPFFTVLLIVFIAIILIITLTSGGTNTEKEIDRTSFLNSLNNGQVAAVHYNNTTFYGIYTGETEEETTQKLESFPREYDFYFIVATNPEIEGIISAIDNYNTGGETGVAPATTVEFTSEPVRESLLSQLLPWIYIILLIVLGYFIFKSISRMTGKNMDFGKNKARMEAGLKVRFSDVAGCEEEKQEMQEIVEFLKNPRKFTDLGARIPKGVLLVGPPGTGKTLLAKAIAGEAGVPFFSITGSDFVEMYVGVGAARVRDLFETAKRNMPCLVFIDEIDAVGRQRGAGLGNTNDEREQTLNQLLVQMDGFESSDGIVVIAATNRPDVLDPALLRAGRFDRRIVVNRPDLEGRTKILKLYAKNKPFADDIDWEGIARRIPGSTGADIENILNEAAILAARDSRNLITETDIFEATLKVEYGPSKKNKKVEEEDRKNTAYHEAGHAIANRKSKYLKQEVQEVTIIPRGFSGGMTARVPEKDYSQYTRDQLIDNIVGAMAGRAAEIIKFGHVATGASNDIQVATEVARDMVTKYGMSEKLGPVCYAEEGEVFLGRDFQQRSNISDATAKLIDDEIKAIIEDCQQRAIDILKENEAILDQMAKVLIERETIYSEEVDELLSGKTADEVIRLMDERQEKRKQKDREALERKEAERREMEKRAQQLHSDFENTVMNAFSNKPRNDEIKITSNNAKTQSAKTSESGNEVKAESKDTDLNKEKTATQNDSNSTNTEGKSAVKQENTEKSVSKNEKDSIKTEKNTKTNTDNKPNSKNDGAK